MARMGLAAVRRAMLATACVFGVVSGLEGCGSSVPDPKVASSYIPLCATAITKVQFDAHILEGAHLTPNDPQVVHPGPPARVMCGAAQGTHIAVITFDAMCDDSSEKGCADIISVDLDQVRISGPIA